MILIQPYANKISGQPNPKNFPYWQEVVDILQFKKYKILQVGIEGEMLLVKDFRKNLPLREIKALVKSCDTWISVDSFLQHLGWTCCKKGVAIFGPSNPDIFGHKGNINLLKDKKYLRPDQFGLWTEWDFDPACWVTAKEVTTALEKLISNK